MAGEEGGHTDTRDTEVSDACMVVVVRISSFENVCELSSIILWDAMLFSFLSGDMYAWCYKVFFHGVVCVRGAGGCKNKRAVRHTGVQTNTFKQI